MRKRTLKVLTLLVLFIFLTSFFLNYSHTMLATTWFPKQMVHELSENFKKLMKYSNRPCTCTRCIGQRRVSSWFDERFNQSMQPLLTAKNALLEEDTYSWWLVEVKDLTEITRLSVKSQAWDSAVCPQAPLFSAFLATTASSDPHGSENRKARPGMEASGAGS